MKILHIAYSLSEQSAAFRLAEEQSVNQGDQIYFLLARKSTSSFVESRRIFPFLTSFIGFLYLLTSTILKKLLENIVVDIIYSTSIVIFRPPLILQINSIFFCKIKQRMLGKKGPFV